MEHNESAQISADMKFTLDVAVATTLYPEEERKESSIIIVVSIVHSVLFRS